MNNDELKNIVNKLNGQGKMNFLEGATEEQIRDFEKNHEVKLPLKFKEWLTFSDGGELFLPAGIQLYGVAHNPLIEANNIIISNSTYHSIGALSTGDPILCENDKENISIYNHEAGKIEEDETYSDFYSFLNDLSNMLGTK